MTQHRGSVAKQINERIAAGDLTHDDDAVIAFCAKLLAPIYGQSVQVSQMSAGRNEVVHREPRR